MAGRRLWALSNPVILTYPSGQSCILHTLTKPATNLEPKSALQYLKHTGLWRYFGIGRFRCLHSLLIQANRCDNPVHSELNVGEPTTPNSQESNCLNLTLIRSIKELYSLWASYTVIKKTCLGMIDQIDINYFE